MNHNEPVHAVLHFGYDGSPRLRSDSWTEDAHKGVLSMVHKVGRGTETRLELPSVSATEEGWPQIGSLGNTRRRLGLGGGGGDSRRILQRAAVREGITWNVTLVLMVRVIFCSSCGCAGRGGGGAGPGRGGGDQRSGRGVLRVRNSNLNERGSGAMVRQQVTLARGYKYNT